MNVKTDMYELMQGDCLELMKLIPDGSVDLVLTDPPYGTVKSIGNSDSIEHGMKNKTQWDETLDFKLMWLEINRVLRRNGKCILFSQEPFTSDLIKSTHKNMPFSYRLVWIKDHFANSLIAKKAPVNYFEDICVFQKKFDTQINPLQQYLLKEFKSAGKSIAYYKELCGFTGNQPYNWFSPKNDGTKHWCFPKKEHYEKLQSSGFFQKPYDELMEVESKFESIFNLPKGEKFKSNVFEYKKDYSGLHPTQKPVALLEDLIKTYTKENETVLDFTMGSGSTVVAALNTNRKAIGIEMNEGYFNIAKERIEKVVNN